MEEHFRCPTGMLNFFERESVGRGAGRAEGEKES